MEPLDSDRKECPRCAEMVKVRAKMCRFCTFEFEESKVQGEIPAPHKLDRQIPVEDNSIQYSAPKGQEIKYGLYGLLFVAILMIAIISASKSSSGHHAPEKRYTLGGDEIQENGLTRSQELEIVSHCNEKPNAWDCR